MVCTGFLMGVEILEGVGIFERIPFKMVYYLVKWKAGVCCGFKLDYGALCIKINGAAVIILKNRL